MQINYWHFTKDGMHSTQLQFNSQFHFTISQKHIGSRVEELKDT